MAHPNEIWSQSVIEDVAQAVQTHHAANAGVAAIDLLSAGFADWVEPGAATRAEYLDAVEYELRGIANLPRHHAALRSIALAIPRVAGSFPRLIIGCNEAAFRYLTPFGGVTSRRALHVVADGATIVIEVASITVAGVEISAQWSRSATVEEQARSTEAVVVAGPCVAVSLS